MGEVFSTKIRMKFTKVRIKYAKINMEFTKTGPSFKKKHGQTPAFLRGQIPFISTCLASPPFSIFKILAE